MAELLVLKNDTWMESLSEAEAEERGVKFKAKWDARQKKGDVTEVGEDGKWAKLNKDNQYYVRISVPHLSVVAAGTLIPSETRELTTEEKATKLTAFMNKEQAVRIKRGKKFDAKEQAEYAAVVQEDLDYQRVMVKKHRFNLDTTKLLSAKQTAIINTGKVSITQAEYGTIRVDRRAMVIS